MYNKHFPRFSLVMNQNKVHNFELNYQLHHCWHHFLDNWLIYESFSLVFPGKRRFSSCSSLDVLTTALNLPFLSSCASATAPMSLTQSYVLDPTPISLPLLIIWPCPASPCLFYVPNTAPQLNLLLPIISLLTSVSTNICLY